MELKAATELVLKFFMVTRVTNTERNWQFPRLPVNSLVSSFPLFPYHLYEDVKILIFSSLSRHIGNGFYNTSVQITKLIYVIISWSGKSQPPWASSLQLKNCRINLLTACLVNMESFSFLLSLSIFSIDSFSLF